MADIEKTLDEALKEFKRHNLDAMVSTDFRRDIQLLHIDTSRHDKQIRDEVIDELLYKLEYRFFDDGLWECVTKEDVYEVAEQMKWGQNEY